MLMNIIKSLVVLIILIILLYFCIRIVVERIKETKQRIFRISKIIGTVILLLATCLSVFNFGYYVYPFEVKLRPVKVAEIDLPAEYTMSEPGSLFWHGAYEAYGLGCGSVYFDATYSNPRFGMAWPHLNWSRYNYVITYGQEIDELSFNVWDEIEAPLSTGAKVGHMKLKEDFHPTKIYIYRIPKIRIENDINHTAG